MKKKIINIVGPSGSGKTTIVGETLKELGVLEIVSHTSREKRPNEIENVTYHYTTKEKILDMIKNNETVEYSNYIGNGDLYCISKKEIEDKLKKCDILFVITDINGTNRLKEIYGDSVYVVFVFADAKTLSNRLIERGDDPKKIIERVTNFSMKNEFENYKYADFVILNKDLHRTKEQVKCIYNIIKED